MPHQATGVVTPSPSTTNSAEPSTPARPFPSHRVPTYTPWEPADRRRECEAPLYPGLSEPDRQTIRRALDVLKASITGQVFDRPALVKDYLTLKYAGLPHEVFGVLWLNAENRLFGEDVLFRGTLTQTSVYPREVAKQALLRNACCVILFHNHPSGCSEPSRADEMLTQTLKQALTLVDVRVLDHLVIAAGGAASLAERGLL